MAKDTSPSLDLEELAQSYGWSLAVLNAIPEVKKLFQTYIKESWTPQKLTASIRNTKWYKTRSESQRQALVLQKTDPAEYNRRMAKMRQHVTSMYGTLTGGKGLSKEFVNRVASQAVMLDWTEEELRNTIARGSNYKALLSKDRLGGEAGQMEDQLRKAAADYGIDVSDTWVGNQIQSAMWGQADVGVAVHALKRMAQSQYRAYADDLERGVTMRDIAEPYIQSMGKTLELNPGSLGMNDPTIRKALTAYDADSGKPTTTPLWQFEQTLRSDKRWNKTQNAQDSLMGVGHDVLTQMGLTS